MESTSKSQQTYFKSKFEETVFHKVIGTVKRLRQYKKHTLADFLDIGGAFNNVTINATTLNHFLIKGYTLDTTIIQ